MIKDWRQTQADLPRVISDIIGWINNQEAAKGGKVSNEGCKPHRQYGQKVDSKPPRKSLKRITN